MGLKPIIETLKAGADLSGQQYKFVKYGSTKDTVVACGANERAIGVVQNVPGSAVGSICEVAVLGGEAYLKLGATVALGQLIKSQADGEGQKAAAAGEYCAALAREAGVASDVVRVFLAPVVAAAAEA